MVRERTSQHNRQLHPVSRTPWPKARCSAQAPPIFEETAKKTVCKIFFTERTAERFLKSRSFQRDTRTQPRTTKCTIDPSGGYKKSAFVPDIVSSINTEKQSPKMPQAEDSTGYCGANRKICPGFFSLYHLCSLCIFCGNNRRGFARPCFVGFSALFSAVILPPP